MDAEFEVLRVVVMKNLLKSSACYLLYADFLLGLFFNPKDGSDMFF
jgi:hypothetical protein